MYLFALIYVCQSAFMINYNLCVGIEKLEYNNIFRKLQFRKITWCHAFPFGAEYFSQLFECESVYIEATCVHQL